MSHSAAVKARRRSTGYISKAKPFRQIVRVCFVLICLLGLYNLAGLFNRNRPTTSRSGNDVESQILYTFSGWTAHSAMTLGLRPSKHPSEDSFGPLYALELKSAKPIKQNDLVAVLTITPNALVNLESTLALLHSESPNLKEITVLCPELMLSAVRPVLHNVVSSFPSISNFELTLHTWATGFDEIDTLLQAASRITTGRILVLDHHLLQGLNSDSLKHILRPLAVSFPMGPKGFDNMFGEDSCLVASESAQAASFLVPPFVAPASLLNGTSNIFAKSQNSWSGLGKQIASRRPDSIGGIVLGSPGPTSDWCIPHSLGSHQVPTRQRAGITPELHHQHFRSSLLSPSPTRMNMQGTFALLLPTTDDLLYFSTAACRLLSSGHRLHVLLYAEEFDDLGPESYDIDIGVTFDDGIVGTDTCDLRYQVSATADITEDFLISSWLDSLRHPPDILIASADEEKLSTYVLQGLKEKKSFGATLIQLPRGDLPYSDWMGTLSLQEWRSWNIPRVDISIITDNRPESLSRLLDSLANARYFGDTLHLRVNMEQSADPETMQLVDDIQWDHGSVFVHHRVVHGGLLPAVVESWYPSSNDSYGLLLEDDVEVSPLFYAWVKLAILRYRYGHQDKSPQLYGISLYQQKNVELRLEGRKPFNARQLFATEELRHPNTPYLSQIPCSWGAVYFPEHWREFHSYLSLRLSEHALPLNQDIVPDVRSNKWTRSWKKYFIELVYLRGYVMLYPNYANFLSLSTNHLEVGSHVKRLPRDIYEKKKALFTVPLLQLPEDISASLPETGLLDLPENRLPSWSNLPVLDLHGNLTLESEVIRRGEEQWSALFNCSADPVPYDARSLLCTDQQLPTNLTCTSDADTDAIEL